MKSTILFPRQVFCVQRLSTLPLYTRLYLLQFKLVDLSDFKGRGGVRWRGYDSFSQEKFYVHKVTMWIFVTKCLLSRRVLCGVMESNEGPDKLNLGVDRVYSSLF